MRSPLLRLEGDAPAEIHIKLESLQPTGSFKVRGAGNALAQADPEAVVWLASRAVSYMDETGFPEAVELWFQEEMAE